MHTFIPSLQGQKASLLNIPGASALENLFSNIILNFYMEI